MGEERREEEERVNACMCVFMYVYTSRTLAKSWKNMHQTVIQLSFGGWEKK